MCLNVVTIYCRCSPSVLTHGISLLFEGLRPLDTLQGWSVPGKDNTGEVQLVPAHQGYLLLVTDSKTAGGDIRHFHVLLAVCAVLAALGAFLSDRGGANADLK